MDIKHDTHFFLGANSKDGFYSMYNGFVDIHGGDFLWLIKGGPGCGKSSFMRTIAKAAHENGLKVEYIQCSGDPSSLDGIYIPEKKLAYMDATAPHVMDATLPAMGDTYLNLGAFYRLGELRPKLTELFEINTRYKAMYKRIYSLLSAAGNLDPGKIPGLVTDADREVARRRALGVADREFGRPTRFGGGKQTHRLLSAISCEGCIRLSGTVNALCKRVYALDDEYGLADTYLRTLADAAQLRTIDTIICHDPLNPKRIEALLLPDLSLGFVATRPIYGEAIETSRNVRLDSIIDKERVQSNRKKIRATSKLRSAILDEAMLALSEAKLVHDDIEALYNPHVDFDSLYALCGEHVRAMLAK